MTGTLPLGGSLGPRAPYVTGAHRHDASDKIGDFPTPLWATRAVFTFGPPALRDMLAGTTVWEPFAGRGTMVKPLREFGPRLVVGSDLIDYGGDGILSGPEYDFRYAEPATVGLGEAPDWVCTNPFFGEATAFWHRAWDIARVGVAMFLPLAFLAGQERHQTIYAPGRMTYVCPFVERVPLFKGRLNRTGASQALYAWFVGLKGDVRPGSTFTTWHIPPCRQALDRSEDWEGWPSMPAAGSVAPLLRDDGA